MMIRTRTALCVLACGAGMLAPAWAQSVGAPARSASAAVPSAAAGLAPTAQVGGQPLKLNGKGVRYRALAKVYEIGLYASARVSSLEQFLAAPGAKRFQLVTLRELSGDALGVAMVQGMQDNAPAAERAKLINHMTLLSKVFADEPKVAPGSTLTIDLLPGRGAVLTLNGRQMVEPIADPLFFPAAARIWLGPRPVDFILKDALLGIESKKPEAG